MRVLTFLLALALMAGPTAVEAKKLKPKYYKACYADYPEMRKMVPKPPADVQKTAKTIRHPEVNQHQVEHEILKQVLGGAEGFCLTDRGFRKDFTDDTAQPAEGIGQICNNHD